MTVFFVPGVIAAQGSKRFVGRGIMIDADPKLKNWRHTIAANCPTVPLLLGPVMIDLTFYFPRPKSHYGSRKGEPYLKDTAPRYKSSTPDADKIARAVLDALTNVIYPDDAQVAVLSIAKLYANADERLGVEISFLPCLT